MFTSSWRYRDNGLLSIGKKLRRTSRCQVVPIISDDVLPAVTTILGPPFAGLNFECICNACAREMHWRFITCVPIKVYYYIIFLQGLQTLVTTVKSLEPGGRPRATLVGSPSAEYWSWADGRRPSSPVLDNFLHLRFQAPCFFLRFSSVRLSHQLIADDSSSLRTPQNHHSSTSLGRLQALN